MDGASHYFDPLKTLLSGSPDAMLGRFAIARILAVGAFRSLPREKDPA
jgi:hypothetical protein